MLLGDDVSVKIDQQRAHALRTAIDGEQQFVGCLGHGGTAPGTA